MKLYISNCLSGSLISKFKKKWFWNADITLSTIDILAPAVNVPCFEFIALLISAFRLSISAFVYLSDNWAYKLALIIPAELVSVL